MRRIRAVNLSKNIQGSTLIALAEAFLALPHFVCWRRSTPTCSSYSQVCQLRRSAFSRLVLQLADDLLVVADTNPLEHIEVQRIVGE